MTAYEALKQSVREFQEYSGDSPIEIVAAPNFIRDLYAPFPPSSNIGGVQLYTFFGVPIIQDVHCPPGTAYIREASIE